MKLHFSKATCGLACMLVSSVVTAPVCAGELDAGSYRLSYDDALGVPTRTSAGGTTTYTFPSYSRVGEDIFFFFVDRFSASLTAAPGVVFALRPDLSLPVWAEARVDAYDFYPDLQPPPGDSALEFPAWASGTDVTVYGTANVSLADSGGGPARVLVDFETEAGGIGALGNLWYGVDCNYNWSEPCAPSYWGGYSWGVPVHVDATFTPVIHVDERFVTAVPEPATTGLGFLGMVLLGTALRRRAVSQQTDGAIDTLE